MNNTKTHLYNLLDRFTDDQLRYFSRFHPPIEEISAEQIEKIIPEAKQTVDLNNKYDRTKG